jgi:CBS domain-containing protein
MNVSDVMTREVVTVHPEMSLRDFALLLSEHRISGMPVLDRAGNLLGVISEADIVAKERGLPRRSTALSWILGEQTAEDDLRRRAATTVGEAMTTPAITIGEDRPLREGAALMLDRDVNRLPVTRGDILVGILTRADLVRAYVRRDQESLATIREEVIRRTMWLDPDDMVVQVREGVARIAGMVDRRSTAAILERLIGLVDGVDLVVNDLSWELDDRELSRADEADREPSAASLASRERPRSLHA